MWRRATIGVLALAIALAMAACGSSSKKSSGSSSSSGGGKTLEVGVLAPFSGDYAIYGQAYMRGVKAWEQINGQPQVNGQKVDVKPLDDRCDVATGVGAVRRDAPNLTALLGPSCSSVAPPLKPLLAQYKLPTLELGHAASITLGAPAGGWFFRISQPDTANQWAFGQYLLDKWKGQGITKFGVIYDTSVTDATAARSWAAIAKQNGVDLVASASFADGTTDFTAQLEKLKQAGAQAYVLQVFGPDESRIVQQVNQLGIHVPLASAEDTPYPFVLQRTPGIDGMEFYSDYVPGVKNADMQAFERAFQKVSPGTTPLDVDYEGWLGMTVLMDALKQPGATAGGEKLRDALAHVQAQVGNLTVSFLPNGDQQQVLTYAGRVQHGRAVLEKLLVSPRTSFPDWPR